MLICNSLLLWQSLCDQGKKKKSCGLNVKKLNGHKKQHKCEPQMNNTTG